MTLARRVQPIFNRLWRFVEEIGDACGIGCSRSENRNELLTECFLGGSLTAAALKPYYSDIMDFQKQ
jgi:hypothetical protein